MLHVIFNDSEFVEKNTINYLKDFLLGNPRILQLYNNGQPVTDKTDKSALISAVAGKLIGNELTLSQCMAKEARDLFLQKYDPDLVKFEIDRHDFITKVEAEITRLEIPADRIALKLIHRYKSGKWCLTIRICEIGNISAGPDMCYVSNKKSFIDIYDYATDGSGVGAVSNVLTAGLTVHGEDCIDEDYFSRVDDRSTFGVLNKELYPKCVIMAWVEFKWLFYCNENAISRPDHSMFKIVFESITDEVNDTNVSYVKYPHALMIYMKYDKSYCLDNDVIKKFYNKAANYNTLCPPRCPVYAWHPDLPQILP